MTTLQSRRPHAFLLSLTGCILTVGPIVFYQSISEASVRAAFNATEFLSSLTYLTLALLALGLFLVLTGFSLAIARGTNSADGSRMGALSSIMQVPGSSRIFLFASLAYGIFFAFASSTLVYQPGAAYTASYGVSVPSAVPVVCCGELGQMPQLVIYLTQQFAMLIVPLNLVLLFIISWLVGLNATIARYSIQNRSFSSNADWFGGLGALTGVFTICPSCAGLFLLSAIGLGSAVGLSTFLSSFQAVFIAAGIPLLLVSPLLGVRRLPSCRTLERNKNEDRFRRN